jgi:hypothetical protein
LPVAQISGLSSRLFLLPVLLWHGHSLAEHARTLMGRRIARTNSDATCSTI